MTEKLTLETVKETIRRKIQLDSGTPHLEGKTAYCVFCQKELKPHPETGGAWAFECSCEKSRDFVSTRATLLREYHELADKLTRLDTEAYDAGLKLYQTHYAQEKEERDTILASNDALIQQLITLGDE